MNKLIQKLFRGSSVRVFNSAGFWESRYRTGGNSGDGSYGDLATFKAEVINAIIAANSITSAIEYGCGDGNNLALYNFKRYTGIDVSHAALEICRKRYKHDESKKFIHFAESLLEKADIALSLDVIYHLVEDQVFFDYLDRLFGSGLRFVLIYSSCVNYPSHAMHVRHRNFLKPVAERYPKWRISNVIANKYPARDLTIQENGCSFADFYLFSKIA